MVEYRLLAAGEFDIEEHIKELAGWVEIPVDITEIEQGWMAVASDGDFEIRLQELTNKDYRSRYDLPLKYEITFSDNQELVMKVVDEWRQANRESFVLMADDQTIAMRRTRVIFFNMDEFIEFDEIFDSFIASDFFQYDG
ncbi:MAG: hypothetical protein L0154_13205 [Chloroflexi bacterium]|nr:hypothetical protein [Chloroflexota bacterium]